MPGTHAILSASSANRWLHCPPSAKLALQFPRTTSKYAEAGTLAHSIAELKARKHFVEPMGPQEFQKRLQVLKESPHYDKTMDGNTDAYLDFLKGLSMTYTSAPFVALEVRVDYSRYVPQAFGTADCIMIGMDRMCVVDYKNGSGVPVEAVENPQMMLYALGALETYSMIYGDTIKQIHLAIVQPNVGEPKEWDTTTEELRNWGETVVKPTAALAWDGKGEFCPGDWCDSGFCPARATCMARAQKMLEVEPLVGSVLESEGISTDKLTLSDAEVGDILTRARGIAKWVKSLEEYALTASIRGAAIPGYKAVLGRSSREWTGGADKAFEELRKRGVEEAVLYTREPVSVSALEKLLGKTEFKKTADGLWEKKPGKPTLAPESDRRKAYVSADTVFKPVEPETETQDE